MGTWSGTRGPSSCPGSPGRIRAVIPSIRVAFVAESYGNPQEPAWVGLLLQGEYEAAKMLLRGSEHKTVYRFLERKRADIRAYEVGF